MSESYRLSNIADDPNDGAPGLGRFALIVGGLIGLGLLTSETFARVVAVVISILAGLSLIVVARAAWCHYVTGWHCPTSDQPRHCDEPGDPAS